MIDNFKIGNQISLLRREKGLTGEQFAEILGVSPQAVSKWENGKNLPETALLPKLAETLGVTIDSILMPQQLFILRAAFTNGVSSTDVTAILSRYVNGDSLDIAVTPQFIGAAFGSERIAVLTVKYQTPEGTYYAFAPQGERLVIGAKNKGLTQENNFSVIGAWYGNTDGFRDVMLKMKHYDYFSYKDLYVNHETFPSSPATDCPEYLTLVYLNCNGIHAISCKENEVLTYSEDRTELVLKDTSVCILPGIMPLSWGKNMDCCWGGSLYAALKFMGEPFTYEQIMGMSGACYRLNFTEIWDWSATDALVAFDYSDPLFRAIGYEQVWADRLNKDDRSVERGLIVSDIQMGKPVVAINLRTAAEWGVITGYENYGKTLYCRTYFDGDLLDEDGKVKDGGGGEYLETEFWPFMLVHFGKKNERPTEDEILRVSLQTLVDSFRATCERGYWQGEEAYQKWIEGLSNNSLWDLEQNRDGFYRRASVNECTLRSLIDERRCATVYLGERGLLEISQMYGSISEKTGAFYQKWIDKWDKAPNGGKQWRSEEIELLEYALETERAIVKAAEDYLKQ
ncbi:MAG: helix-turn-helix domain-containing protein [Clostridiales bacterium]|jgi:transcriptional regulator with XRE-family HTH domain|nr:helix-turn-helix domain-containing protein [Clostridiales bacterium]